MRKEAFLIRPYTSKGHKKKDGSYPLVLSIRRNTKRKYIFLGTSSTEEQWDFDFQLYKVDKRMKNLHPDRTINNKWLAEVKKRCIQILDDFQEKRINWTLNQFEQQFLNNAKHSSVEDYFLKHIESLKNAGKTGNKNAYQNTLIISRAFDSGFSRVMFGDINIKYITRFDKYLRHERNCADNTIKYYIKTLRALINKAIKDGEASEETYPFGKNGYSIAKLEKETEKRYLPSEYIDKLKIANLRNQKLRWVRNLFLFSYYCQGMSYADMASLTKKSILVFEGGKYIAYRRNKTESSGSKIIRIKISPNIQKLLNWFKKNTTLIGDYLIPCVSISGYKGEELYRHIRNRYKKYNDHLKTLGEELEFEGIRLSSYVSRHSYAMRLKNNGIAEDIISEALGHKDLSTTKVYLDSFQKDEIAKANELL